MNNKTYKLIYLPIFKDDLVSVVTYISDTLMNEQAALNLLDKVEKSILKRLENPVAFEPYHSLSNRKEVYYRIIVNNYSVFYVVKNDVMEVRRFLYNGRNMNNII